MVCSGASAIPPDGDRAVGTTAPAVGNVAPKSDIRTGDDRNCRSTREPMPVVECCPLQVHLYFFLWQDRT